jgi:hypothetical protein
VKVRLTLWVTLGLIAALVCGCRKNAAAVGSDNTRIFATADPATKANWEAAMTAFKTNGYADALVTLGRLSQQSNLTPEQLAAVKQTTAAISDQMWTAANKGDANAVRAVMELRKVQQR